MFTLFCYGLHRKKSLTRIIGCSFFTKINRFERWLFCNIDASWGAEDAYHFRPLILPPKLGGKELRGSYDCG